MIKNNFLIFILLGVLSVSCTQSFDDKKGLTTYLSDEANGYFFSKNINSVDYILQYKPTDIMVIQENENPNKEELKLLREKYKKNIYFTISMEKDGNELLNKIEGDRERYLALVNDLTFKMNEKIVLQSGKDTIPMLQYNYPRAYGMAKATTLLLIYPRNLDVLKKKSLQLKINDIGFATGEVNFKIDNNKIINEPFLTF